MTTYRREAFQPEELAILGSAFDQIWSAVGAELGGAEPRRKAGARTRLANIIVLLAKLGGVRRRGDEAMSVKIFIQSKSRSAATTFVAGGLKSIA